MNYFNMVEDRRPKMVIIQNAILLKHLSGKNTIEALSSSFIDYDELNKNKTGNTFSRFTGQVRERGKKKKGKHKPTLKQKNWCHLLW